MSHYVIAKRGSSSKEWHLWRTGARIQVFETQSEAIAMMEELATNFGFDSLMLLEQVGVEMKLEVGS